MTIIQTIRTDNEAVCRQDVNHKPRYFLIRFDDTMSGPEPGALCRTFETAQAAYQHAEVAMKVPAKEHRWSLLLEGENCSEPFILDVVYPDQSTGVELKSPVAAEAAGVLRAPRAARPL